MITIPYPPSVNMYWRMAVIGGRPRMLLSREARQYKERVEIILRAKALKPLQGAVRLRATVYRPARRGDLDNTLKALLDALRGHLYDDDSQVAEIHVKRAEDKVNPRVELEVTSLEG